MPAIASLPGEINNDKSLRRTANRSGRLAKMHQVAFPAQSASHLWKAQRTLQERITELKRPVQRVVGKGENERVVEINDDKALCDCIRTLCNVIEMRRVVLRIPGPGRDSGLEAKLIDIPAAAAIDVQEIERMAKDAERVVNESEQSASNSGSVSPTDSLPSS